MTPKEWAEKLYYQACGCNRLDNRFKQATSCTVCIAKIIKDALEECENCEKLREQLDEKHKERITVNAVQVKNAIAMEREACAKVAENSDLIQPSGSIGPLFDMGWSSAIKHIAQAIRSRK